MERDEREVDRLTFFLSNRIHGKSRGEERRLVERRQRREKCGEQVEQSCWGTGGKGERRLGSLPGCCLGQRGQMACSYSSWGMQDGGGFVRRR